MDEQHSNTTIKRDAFSSDFYGTNNQFFSFQTHREHHYSGILVDFAIQLMTLLENINRDSFQRFRLRAGLNQVRGAIQKPRRQTRGKG